MTTTATNEIAIAPTSATLDQTANVSFTQVYREMADQHVESDVLVQLKSNLAQLEDLHGRLKFMMNEISYLLKRS